MILFYGLQSAYVVFYTADVFSAGRRLRHGEERTTRCAYEIPERSSNPNGSYGGSVFGGETKPYSL